jgi:hypothetical protein
MGLSAINGRRQHVFRLAYSMPVRSEPVLAGDVEIKMVSLCPRGQRHGWRESASGRDGACSRDSFSQLAGPAEGNETEWEAWQLLAPR